MRNNKLCFIFGTRPEIIKLAPVIKLCLKKKVPFFSIHSGQHYSFRMERIFFRQLGLPLPQYRLNVRSQAPYLQGEHTGRMLIGIEKVLLRELPYCVLVQGDTNTVLAGSLTAEKISTTKSYTGLEIKLAHVEAGLRSFDRSMPEETNRFIADHLSDFLFAPTENARALLLKEGLPRQRIYVTGNTIVDALGEYKDIAISRNKVKSLTSSPYMLLTLHRQENVDAKVIFSSIIKGLGMVYDKFRLPIIFPIHPRTEKMLSRFGLHLPSGIRRIAAVGLFDFLALEAKAELVLTDSGGVQEEACVLKVPCVTLRSNTERPETLQVGANMLAGSDPTRIFKAAEAMLKRRRNWDNPLGDGRAAARILSAILKKR